MPLFQPAGNPLLDIFFDFRTRYPMFYLRKSEQSVKRAIGHDVVAQVSDAFFQVRVLCEVLTDNRTQNISISFNNFTLKNNFIEEGPPKPRKKINKLLINK